MKQTFWGGSMIIETMRIMIGNCRSFNSSIHILLRNFFHYYQKKKLPLNFFL